MSSRRSSRCHRIAKLELGDPVAARVRESKRRGRSEHGASAGSLFTEPSAASVSPCGRLVRSDSASLQSRREGRLWRLVHKPVRLIACSVWANAGSLLVGFRWVVIYAPAPPRRPRAPRRRGPWPMASAYALMIHQSRDSGCGDPCRRTYRRRISLRTPVWKPNRMNAQRGNVRGQQIVASAPTNANNVIIGTDSCQPDTAWTAVHR